METAKAAAELATANVAPVTANMLSTRCFPEDT